MVVIIKESIKHHKLEVYKVEHTLARRVALSDYIESLNILTKAQ